MLNCYICEYIFSSHIYNHVHLFPLLCFPSHFTFPFNFRQATARRMLYSPLPLYYYVQLLTTRLSTPAGDALYGPGIPMGSISLKRFKIGNFQFEICFPLSLAYQQSKYLSKKMFALSLSEPLAEIPPLWQLSAIAIVCR